MTTHLWLVVGVLLLALHKDGDVVMLGVEDGVCDGKDIRCLDPQTGFFESFTLGTLEVGFSKLEVSARKPPLPCQPGSHCQTSLPKYAVYTQPQ